jgi:hypothetical protein
MAHGAIVARVLTTTKTSRPPSAQPSAETELNVSLREIKARAQRLDPSHPLRILVMAEPDELPRYEYAVKVVGWFRLISSPADSGRLGGR